MASKQNICQKMMLFYNPIPGIVPIRELGRDSASQRRVKGGVKSKFFNEVKVALRGFDSRDARCKNIHEVTQASPSVSALGFCDSVRIQPGPHGELSLWPRFGPR